MSFGTLFKKVFQHPLARNIDLESPDHIAVHRRILDSNPLLLGCYRRWYRELLPAYERTRDVPGLLVELGCGAGFLEEFIPGLLKTDCVPNPLATRQIDAMRIDLPDESVRALFMVAVFHHLPRPIDFLSEVQRVLAPGGRLALVEPHNSFPQRFLCKILDHYEYFDDTIKDWQNDGAQTLLNANLALAWMAFVRDADRFHTLYPRLRIVGIRFHTFIAGMISGGMSYRPFLPGFALPLVNAWEFVMHPLGKWLATGMTIDIEKRR